MDLFQVVLFGAMIVGIFLVVFSLFVYTTDARGAQNNYFETSNMLRVLESSVDEIDKTMEELSETSKSIFEELDEKYQELLFLYALIDDKKNELASIYQNNGAKAQTNVPEEVKPKALKNPRLKDIEALEKQGLSVSEIARSLHMGQGEVKLILELGRVR